MVDQLCSTADVKVRMNASGQVADATDDPLLSSLIDQASAWITGYTGRQFVASSGVTYEFDTVAGTILRVPRGIRVATTVRLASSSQPDSAGSYTATAAANVLLRPKPVDRLEGWPATEIVLTGASFGSWANGAQVVGDWGWAAVPSDIAGVCMDAVVMAYANRADGLGGAIGPDGTQVPLGISGASWAILKRYRDWPRGLS